MLATNRSAGATAAMLGASEMVVAGLAAGAVSLLHDNTAWSLSITIAALMAVTVGLAVSANRRGRRGRSD